jgi:protein-S-isoprenylcysteine O-methyltransferase Ste14
MFTGPLFASGLVLLSIQLFGVVLGIWAVLVMKLDNFKITPVPKTNAILRINGPYNLIRHPMYTSILLFTLPELIQFYSWWRLVIFIILVFVLIVKLYFEEAKLKEKFPEYIDYMENSKRIIPYVF